MRGPHIAIEHLWATANAHTQYSNSAKCSRGSVAKILVILAISVTAGGAWAADPPREQAIKIVVLVQRADYEGDRIALKRLYAELTSFVGKKELVVRVRYWRGFALWRRAINGFNESADPRDLELDLQDAVVEFNEAAASDSSFADAKIAAASCLGYLAYLHQKDQAQVQTYVGKIRLLLQDVWASAPDNPRLYWVLGQMDWSRPVEKGGGQAKAFEMYEKGLEAIRKRKTITAIDPLEPSWGEPELLMNLAWSNLNRATPDLNAAEKYAHSALALVPYWHYVRDILMLQIREAKRADNRTGARSDGIAQRRNRRSIDAGARL